MRGVAVLAVLALAACGPAEEPSAPACRPDPSAPSPRARVFLRPVETKVRRDLPRAQVAALREAAGETDTRLQGLMRADLRLGVSYEVARTASRKPGTDCAWLESVTVDLTPASYEILVPSEYPEGSCEHDVVLAHERDHEERHRRGLERAKAALEEALAAPGALPGASTPTEIAEDDKAAARFGETARKVVEPVYERYKEELAAEQAALDQADEYARVTGRCRGWR